MGKPATVRDRVGAAETIMQEIEFWWGFSQDDIGKEIEVSGRAGPRWFYRPLVKIKKKVFYLLPWQVEHWAYRIYRKIVPLRVLELVEMVCYVPTANSGIYLVKDVLDQRAVVEKVR